MHNSTYIESFSKCIISSVTNKIASMYCVKHFMDNLGLLGKTTKNVICYFLYL